MRGLILLIIMISIGFSCQRNIKPVIDNILAEPDSIYPGDTITLSFNSPNIKEVDHFEWSCSSGLWISDPKQPNGTIRWVAPQNFGNYYIKLNLYNGDLVTADSIAVKVLAPSGTFTDNRDSQLYHWIRIGKQIWMAENLAYLPQVDRYSSYSTDEERFYVYGYNGNKVPDARNTVYFQLYGVLYNRPAAEAVCPEGWHLPLDDDWLKLTTFLTPNAGRKMKSATGWEMDYYGNDCNGDNSSGFNALPGGSYAYDLNHGVPAGFQAGKYALFWAHNYSSIIIIQSNAYSLDRGENAMSGLSVRCIKNNE